MLNMVKRERKWWICLHGTEFELSHLLSTGSNDHDEGYILLPSVYCIILYILCINDLSRHESMDVERRAFIDIYSERF